MKLRRVRLAKGIGKLLILGTAVALVAPLVYAMTVVRPAATLPSAGAGHEHESDARSTTSVAPTSSQTNSLTDATSGLYAFTDLGRRTYNWIGTNPANKQLYGSFVFYVDGVGTFLPTGVASVTVRHGQKDLDVSYDGPGSIDKAAKMDLELARSLTAGTPTPTMIRLSAHIDPDHHTAEINFWVGGKSGTNEHGADGDHRTGSTHYQLVAKQPDSPDATAKTIARLTKAQDWAGLYGLCDTSYRNLASKDQWLKEESAGFSAWLNGATISDVSVSALSAPTNDVGYWTARFTLTITTSGTAGMNSRSSVVILIYEASGWHMATGKSAS